MHDLMLWTGYMPQFVWNFHEGNNLEANNGKYTPDHSKSHECSCEQQHIHLMCSCSENRDNSGDATSVDCQVAILHPAFKKFPVEAPEICVTPWLCLRKEREPFGISLTFCFVSTCIENILPQRMVGQVIRAKPEIQEGLQLGTKNTISSNYPNTKHAPQHSH